MKARRLAGKVWGVEGHERGSSFQSSGSSRRGSLPVLLRLDSTPGKRRRKAQGSGGDAGASDSEGRGS